MLNKTPHWIPVDWHNIMLSCQGISFDTASFTAENFSIISVAFPARSLGFLSSALNKLSFVRMARAVLHSLGAWSTSNFFKCAGMPRDAWITAVLNSREKLLL